MRVARAVCLMFFLAVAPTACATTTPSRFDASATYANPLPVPETIADPFIFREGDTYYLYGTIAEDGLVAWTSKDLVRWEPRGHVYRRTKQTWAKQDFWAPELFKHRGKYYLHFTAEGSGRRRDPLRRLILAEGDSPLGPFRDLKAPWFDAERNTIDGHVFRDRDGKLYLYFVVLPDDDVEHFEIRVRRLDDDLNPARETTLCMTPSEPWEGTLVNEGPIVLRHGDTYLMTYSGQPFWSVDYAVGIATAPSPMGPWTKSTDGPILQRGEGVNGPGHHSFIESPDGKELFIVYHVHRFADQPGDPRAMAIDRAKIVQGPDGKPTIKVTGPTTRPQPLPSGAPAWHP